ncbi:DNA mismatch repair protein [Mucilaginibacter sp.]|uniref:MutS-related protein n=1 Tax=Mucilaginibacter sp. TaxID=1882438 RepID=UPI0035BC130B
MSFNTDKQTLDDLNILGRPGAGSVFNLYNNTNTRGGADILEKMFLYPLSDVESVNERSRILKYFNSIKVKFPFETEQLDSAEIYLNMKDPRTKLSHSDNNLARKVGNLLSAEGDYKLIYNGIVAIIGIFQSLNTFISTIKTSASQTPYQKEMEGMMALLTDEDLQVLLKDKYVGKLSYTTTVDYDDLIRFKFSHKIRQLLSAIYHLDVYISIAEIALKRGYIFPKALSGNEHAVRITGVYHPLVNNAVANTINITPESNIIFLTGANMAGKSTFMKSLGIALYLAHMGFPVAASHMEFSIRDGMYTTINLPDDLSSGNSHFYAEVLRVKKVAKELGQSKNLFIIFDELFRGTNVKDAYEGTIAITEAFAQKRNCMFLVSTHIIEAGDILRESCDNINFVYLPTKMNGNIPEYTYTIEPGITADRHGMIIINNEGILDIIKSRENKTTAL